MIPATAAATVFLKATLGGVCVATSFVLCNSYRVVYKKKSITCVIKMAGMEISRAELHYVGTGVTSNHLPPVFVLDSGLKTIFNVGREEDCDLVLNSPTQQEMVSRLHARLSYVSAVQDKKGLAYWKLTDHKSTNGMLYNGVRSVECKLNDGDLITFGGARTAALGGLPPEKAKKSIYCYRFHVSSHDSTASTPGTHAHVPARACVPCNGHSLQQPFCSDPCYQCTQMLKSGM